MARGLDGQLAALALAAAVVVALCGCTASTSQHTGQESFTAPVDMSRAQLEALADGVVERAEYEEAFSSFVTCMRNAGYEVTVDPPGGDVILYHYLAQAAQDAAAAPCYANEFRGVDMAWQLAHESTSQTSALLRACLEATGLEAAEEPAAIHEQFVANGMHEEECLAAAARN